MPKRIVIYARDIENITGRKPRTARQLLQRVRENLNRPKDALITVREFCAFTGFDEDQVMEFIID